MVSLRKSSSSTPKFMFTEGERVLCYEPDPNKAKVLYDSKILDIIHTNKKAEYSVHFFGWSNSWNRIVCEEYILKDTPSNRQLQRELAAQAAGSLKGKKLKLNKIPTIIKDVISSLNSNEQENHNSKDGYEHTSNIDSVFVEESSNSNFFTQSTNSNSTMNENTNQSNLTSSDFQSAVSAINTNQTVIKSVNEANFFTIINNQITTNCSDITTNDNHYQKNQELCQQIIANLDEQLKNLLEKDQQLICVEKTLYHLPVKEYTVHKILDEYEKFGLRMLNSSKQLSSNLNKNKNENLKDQSNNQTNNQASQNHINTRTNSRLNTHQTINNQINQSNNFNSSNSSGSSGSSNCLNSNKQLKETSLGNATKNSTPNSFTNQILREFTNSIEIYFNTLTDKMYLFYSDNERNQYKQLKKLDNYLKPVHTFGLIHLLRLIILLPDFLSFCSIPTKQLKQVIFILKHFCNYLLENKTKFTSS